MKILHVITSLRLGGAEKLLTNLIPLLKNYGHEVDLLVFDGADAPLAEEVRESGVNVMDFGINNSVYSLKNLIKLFPFFKKYDIIHSHNTAPQFFCAICSLLFRRAYIVTTEHSGSNRRRNLKGFRLIDKWMYKRYRNVICVSKKTESNLKQYLKNANNIISINNGINVKNFEKATPTTVLETIAPFSRKIIMVAGFRWEKDQPTLIRALNFMPDDYHLFLVGDGVRRKEYEELIKFEGLNSRVHFLGIRTDVANLLQEADFIVMSSHFEGLSLSSLEGMSIGKPFIASDVEGLHDIVENAGILFKHGDSKDLANKILELDSFPNIYKEISNKCRLKAKEFDIEKTASQYNDIYLSIEKQKF